MIFGSLLLCMECELYHFVYSFFSAANIDPIDTEKRARLFRQRPVIYTRFIFNSLVQAIANCVSSNKNLSVLKLEGLPLQDGYIETIAKVR